MANQVGGRRGFAIPLISCGLIILLMPPNLYYAAKLGGNVEYIVDSAVNVSCGILAPLSWFGEVLSVAFLGVGAWAIVQAIVFRRCSASLLFGLMSTGHHVLLGLLYLLRNSYCSGNGIAVGDLKFYTPMIALVPIVLVSTLLVALSSINLEEDGK